MRRAQKGKNIFTAILITVCSVIAVIAFAYVYITYGTAKEQPSVEEISKLQTVENTEQIAEKKAVEIVSVEENAILDQEKTTSINASKQSSLEKAIENLMEQTETE